MSHPAIEVNGLVKRYGDHEAVAGLSFTVQSGEIFGLLGPNGAGKTTTVDVLSTLSPPTSGSVRVGGHDVVSEGHAVRRRIALTGQFAAVDEQLSGTENLVLFGRLRGLNKGAAATRSAELLDAFGLSDAADKKVGDYSGGMRRRLDIACSLTIEPSILFLDEPTTGLDPRSRADLWSVVRDLQQRGMTIVLTTQYLEEADLLADRIMVIDQGRSVAEGTPGELKSATGGTTCVVSLVDGAKLDIASQALSGLGELNLDVDQGQLSIASDDSVETLTAALSLLKSHSIRVQEAAVRQPTLDEVFLALTEASTR